VTTKEQVKHKLKREVGLTWRLFNLGPTLTYRRSGERPAGEAARVLAALERNGVATTSVSALLGSDDLLVEMQEAAAALEREKADELAAARAAAAARGDVGEKTYLVELLGRIATADPCSPWARMALHPDVRGVANGYFGMRTQVRDYNVWRNIRTDSPLRESQLWHRDWREDRYVLPPSAWLTAAGPAGTLLFADTTGWHKGGSARTGDRLLYTCLFGSQAGDKRRRLRPNPELSLAEQDPDTIFALDLIR
jgi:hypothetical protein